VVDVRFRHLDIVDEKDRVPNGDHVTADPDDSFQHPLAALGGAESDQVAALGLPVAFVDHDDVTFAQGW